MKRIEAIRAVYPRLEGCAVVTIMGAVAAELQSIGHRPNFFYLQHAMGLASSMGLGIAVSRPDLTVVVLDGDGSVLMNLGGLTTLARYRPGNLVHVVFDNESLLSVGGFPTATVQFEETGIILTATPHVTGGDHILLTLRVERSAADFAESDIGLIFRTQNVETRVLVRDGETVVMGGLTVTERIEVRSGIPLLMNLPLLGALFRSTSELETQRDLMILVTPHIVQRTF